MTSPRERFAALMAGQGGPVPLDIGGTSLTGMSGPCAERLARRLGLSGEPERTWQGLDERILLWAGTPFRSVGGIVSPPSVHSRRLAEDRFVNCWGIEYARMGQYWEISRSPLRGATLDDLRAFRWPEPRIEEALLAKWERQARELRDQGRYVVVGEHPVFGILELGCWMCGYDDFLMKMVLDEPFVRAFFDRYFEIQMAIVEQYYAVLGPYLDLTTSGDDFGAQQGPLLSPELFDRLIAPHFSARIARTKELTRGWFWHHTCGSVVALLDRLIDCGVDILNPVQTSAAGMAPADLKRRAGGRLAFWGGMDVQQFLPRATPAQVRARADELSAQLGRGGRYVMAPAHNIQADVPPENIVAWVEHLTGR